MALFVLSGCSEKLPILPRDKILRKKNSRTSKRIKKKIKKKIVWAQRKTKRKFKNLKESFMRVFFLYLKHIEETAIYIGI